LLGIFISDTIYLTNKSELFNILWWSIFVILTSTELNSKQNCDLFVKYFASITFIGSIISGFTGLLKIVLIEYYGIIIESIVFNGEDVIFGTSLYADYNVYALSIFFGIICGKYLKDNSDYKKFYTYLSNITFPFLFCSMILSGSRRAVVLGFFALCIFFYFDLSSTRSIKWNFQNRLRKIVRFLILSISIIILSYTIIESTIENAEFANGINRLLTIKEDFGGKNDRTERWEYSLKYFKEMNFAEFLIGRGFDYINDFGKKFNNGYDDHPHNFIIATLLFGGIIGVLLIIIVLIKSLRIYYSRNYFSLFFLILVFLIFFSFTSSNSLFSFRIIPFLLLLPGVINIKQL
jgi:O-antigen ligase